MLQIMKSMWVLYFGLSVLWLGTGMMFSLLVIRANSEGFTTIEIGIMQTCYQLGWIAAAVFAGRMIRHVGHVRVFSAMAAASSAIILVHLLYIDPWLWSLERFLTGICTATLMVVMESWLNDMSENRVRGRVLAVYTMLSWGTPVLGVWVLRYNSTDSAFFFLLASICISIAVIPMLLSASRTPSFIEAERLGLAELFRISPLGVIGALLSGACHGAFFVPVTLFGTVSGFTVEQVSTLTAIALAGGIVTQWPIAMLSDRMDRRIVLMSVAAIGGFAALYFALRQENSVLATYIGTACISATALSLYSLCISHANDYLSPKQIVPASGTLILVYGAGMAATPAVISPLLAISPHYYFVSNATLMLLLAAYVLYRMTRRSAATEQGDTLAVSTASPYASIVSVAEEWGENVPTEQAEHDRISGT